VIFRISSIIVLLTCVVTLAFSQDSVDVTFRYTPPGNPSIVYLVGEFNGWNNQAWPMTPDGNNVFVRTARLPLGGQPGGVVAGAYQYKFYYPGVSSWPNDPLNHLFNPSDNNNSFVYINDPTVFQLMPNERSGAVVSANPTFSAYLFPKVGSSIDTSSISLKVGGRIFSRIGRFYDKVTRLFSFQVPDRLSNGTYKVVLNAGSSADSVSVTVQSGFIQITNLGNFVTRNPLRTLYGSVTDTSLHDIRIVRNALDTIPAAASSGQFTLTVPLREGPNVFTALVRDKQGALQSSDPVSFTYRINHAPDADIYFIDAGSNIIFSAQGTIDPDSGQTQKLSLQWYADAGNPQPLPGITGATASQVTLPKPAIPGDYFFTLIATDPDGNKDTTRNYFSLSAAGTVLGSTRATIPQWARQGRLYEMFFKSMTTQGTIRSAMGYLPYLKSLGINIIWLMPIMENAAPINNRTGPGYNIKNFLKVAPEYGTNADFKDFVRQAHDLGIRVILDVTPNHTSYQHPFVLEARQFRENSPYWNFYQHSYIPHNTNGLGQSSTSDGFYYYSGFSDQLLNYNWSDVDARSYMIEVYKWWVKEFDIDGYRFDVYWGPHRRAGGGVGNELEMGAPVRKALKKLKPDIFLLAEDDGTGSGTEVIFADRNGGVDAGYDWSLYGGAIKPFSFDYGGIENLHARYYNNNFHPGPNATVMRFMENHDEERVVVLPNYGTYQRTMPMATSLFTVPGLPLIYAGQEVGMGPGISDFYQRTRGVIDWNVQGKNTLLPHYQRLATIRAQVTAFSTQKFNRLSSGNDLVYAYTRPQAQGDAIVAVNFGAASQSIALNVAPSNLEAHYVNGRTYYANDLLNDTSYSLVYNNGFQLQANLKPYGSIVCVASDSIKRLNLPLLVSVDENETRTIPSDYRLSQNYPNPFNPSTTFEFRVLSFGFVSLRIFDVLGREVATLVNELRPAGAYTVRWDASLLPSGVYFYRLHVGDVSTGGTRGFVETRKMILAK
jgi:cyclomaltodextrinase / maltogenic alpha-amylase / neopullulanase